MVCERSSIWAAFGGDKICLLSSRLLPATNGSYKAASLRHCFKPGSRSALRTISRASPSVLEIKKCSISWSISFVTPNSCCRCVTEIGCFWFSAAFIACFSVAYVLTEPVGHQGLRLHQPDARPCIDHTAESCQFLMHSLMTCRYSLQLFLQFMVRSLSRHDNARISCFLSKRSAAMQTCDLSRSDLSHARRVHMSR